MLFWLTFKRGPHGSGTNLGYQDVMEMEFSEIRFYWKFLWRVWDAEKDAS